MPTGLALDTLDDVASFVCAPGDLVALRCASRACLEAVRRAVNGHPYCSHQHFSQVKKHFNVQGIAARGRVFGGGCRSLSFECPWELLSSFRSFVINTEGRLRTMYITTTPIAVRPLMVMLRACPLLTQLSLDWVCPTSTKLAFTTLDKIDQLAAEISRACPLLEDVRLPRVGGETHQLCQAETFAMHFPRVRSLKFYGIWRIGPQLIYYEPSHFDRIEEAGRRCVCADELDLSESHVSPALVEVLVRTPLRERVTSIDCSFNTDVSPGTMLQCSRGFVSLRKLALPEKFPATPAFYDSLWRARPELKSLHLMSSFDDDSCIRMICERFSLEELHLWSMKSLTPAVVDMILSSPCARTLRAAHFGHHDHVFDLPALLRIANGCPLLSALDWDFEDTPYSESDYGVIDSICAVQKSRGGRMTRGYHLGEEELDDGP